MYREFAKYYDKIYHRKNYKKEVRVLKKLIRRYKRSLGNDLLDLATGTGNHIAYFCDSFNCTGLDLNEEILAVARSKGLNATFVQGDMQDFNLQKQFEVITCLFSSIGYLLTEAALEKAFKCIYHHLKPGGVVFIEPWLEREVYRVGSPHMEIYDDNDLKIARLNVSELKKESIAYFKMHYLVAERNKPVEYFVDEHELALLPHSLLITKMQEVGLKTKVYAKEVFKRRTLLIGLKPEKG